MTNSEVMASEPELSPCSGQGLGVPRRKKSPNVNWSFCVKEKEISRPAAQSWSIERAGFRYTSEPAGKCDPQS